jgi:hypothetical protein
MHEDGHRWVWSSTRPGRCAPEGRATRRSAAEVCTIIPRDESPRSSSSQVWRVCTRSRVRGPPLNDGAERATWDRRRGECPPACRSASHRLERVRGRHVEGRRRGVRRRPERELSSPGSHAAHDLGGDLPIPDRGHRHAATGAHDDLHHDSPAGAGRRLPARPHARYGRRPERLPRSRPRSRSGPADPDASGEQRPAPSPGRASAGSTGPSFLGRVAKPPQRRSEPCSRERVRPGWARGSPAASSAPRRDRRPRRRAACRIPGPRRASRLPERARTWLRPR